MNKSYEFTLDQSSGDVHVDSRIILSKALEEIKKTLEAIPSECVNNPDNLYIVLGHEDFWCGGQPVGGNNHQCLHMEDAYRFFANEMCALSKAYPNVLLMPGSIYVSVPSYGEAHIRYLQEDKKIEDPTAYGAGVAPVFYNGEWLRLVKKGLPLVKKENGKKFAVLSENQFSTIALAPLPAPEKITMVVPAYHEDELVDERCIPRLVFFGETPLLGEGALLRTLGKNNPDFFSPVFTVRGWRYGVEICADHGLSFLEDQKPRMDGLDVHVLMCYGQVWRYDGTNDQGMCLRADKDGASISQRKYSFNFDEKENHGENLPPPIIRSPHSKRPRIQFPEKERLQSLNKEAKLSAPVSGSSALPLDEVLMSGLYFNSPTSSPEKPKRGREEQSPKKLTPKKNRAKVLFN